MSLVRGWWCFVAYTVWPFLFDRCWRSSLLTLVVQFASFRYVPILSSSSPVTWYVHQYTVSRRPYMAISTVYISSPSLWVCPRPPPLFALDQELNTHTTERISTVRERRCTVAFHKEKKSLRAREETQRITCLILTEKTRHLNEETPPTL